MILNEFLEFIVSVIAACFDGSQNDDLPIGHAFPALVGIGAAQNLRFQKFKDPIQQIGLGMHMLQSTQNGNNTVSALGIEFDLSDGNAIQL
jgi:hypothetical protein